MIVSDKFSKLLDNETRRFVLVFVEAAKHQIVDSERNRLIVVDRGTRFVPLFVDHGTRSVPFYLYKRMSISSDFQKQNNLSPSNCGLEILFPAPEFNLTEKVVRIPLEGDEILRVHSERTQGVVKTLMNAKFRIDLVPEATSVAKSQYRLAPLEMQELSEQLRELQEKVLELLRKEKLYAEVTKSEAVKNWEVPTKPSEI
ncbi:hypothetical protein Tco_0413716 [Tanacetum coccineum]